MEAFPEPAAVSSSHPLATSFASRFFADWIDTSHLVAASAAFTGEDGEDYTVDVTIDTFDEDTGKYTIYAEVVA